MNKEIKDQASIRKIVDLLYGKLPVSLHYNDKNYPVQIVTLKDKGLVISLTQEIPGDERELVLVHNGNKFTTFCKKLGGSASGLEVLALQKILIEEATRSGVRVTGAQGLTASNMINVQEISKATTFDDSKVDKMLKVVTDRLKSQFDHVNIYYSSRMDNRLRQMINYNRSIYIQNKNNLGLPNTLYLPNEEYKKIVEVGGITDHSLVSEICVPIKYKNYIPLGYVQVMHSNVIPEEKFSIISGIAEVLSKDLIKTGIFQESKEVCETKDLSDTGMSFVYLQSKNLGRNFTMGQTIILDLNYNSERIAVVRAIIKNILNQETAFRVGLQFYNLTHSDQEMIEAYLQDNGGK